MADDTVTQSHAEPAPPSPVGWEPELAELRQRQALARELGGKDRVQRQHAGGRLTVRERIDHMLDPGSFQEIGSIAGKASYDARGDITGFIPGNCVFGRGTVDGRRSSSPATILPSVADRPTPPSKASRRCRRNSPPSSACRSFA